MMRFFSQFTKLLGFFALLAVLTTAHSKEQTADEKTTATADAAQKVVVYSARKEHLIEPIFARFTKDTGIAVEFQTGKANALVERLKAEGKNTPADILMTVDVGNLWYAADQGLFQPMNSAVIEKNIPAHLRDPEQLWTGLSIRARTFVYSTERVKPEELTTYADLADPKWKGRLCLRTSKKVYSKSLVSSIIAHHGEEAAEKIVKGWVANLAAVPHAKDSHVMDAILAGGCDVGIVNTYYYGRLQAKQPDVALKLAWANQATTGAHVNVSGAGLLKHAKHPEAAKQLLEWLSDEAAQKDFGGINKEYPANPTLAVDEVVKSWGEFKQDELNLAKIGELQDEAVKLSQRAGYK
ncbi:MAG: extracellular solute-binding protein [bacterium]